MGGIGGGRGEKETDAYTSTDGEAHGKERDHCYSCLLTLFSFHQNSQKP